MDVTLFILKEVVAAVTNKKLDGVSLLEHSASLLIVRCFMMRAICFSSKLIPSSFFLYQFIKVENERSL